MPADRALLSTGPLRCDRVDSLVQRNAGYLGGQSPSFRHSQSARKNLQKNENHSGTDNQSSASYDHFDTYGDHGDWASSACLRVYLARSPRPIDTSPSSSGIKGEMRETGETADIDQPNPGLRTGQKTTIAGKNGNVPPVANRFQPGRSGNPGGRPKQVLAPLMRELLVADDYRIAKTLVRTWLQKACSGNRTALSEVLNRVDGDPARGGARE